MNFDWLAHHAARAQAAIDRAEVTAGDDYEAGIVVPAPTFLALVEIAKAARAQAELEPGALDTAIRSALATLDRPSSDGTARSGDSELGYQWEEGRGFVYRRDDSGAAE